MHANIKDPHLKYLTPAVEELKAKVEEKLQQRFADGLVSSTIDYDFPVFVVKRDILADVVEYLYNDADLSFQFLTTFAASHQPEEKGAEFVVMYQLHNLPNNWRIRLKTFAPVSDPKVPTATTVFAAANWQERETYDFYGIEFVGHPNLSRILNMDEMTYFPLRKEYPLEDLQREDKNDTMFGR